MGANAGSIVTGLNPTAVNNANPFPLFVIQACIIIGLCYILHMGLRKLKQPRVISEVIAGILLGPSVMGRIPGFATTIFNPASLPFLNLVANIGLVFFLFLVGLELDPAMVVKRAKFALGISFAGMVLPLGVGAAVSYVLYKELGDTTTVGFGQFLLFCGVAMAITAFPVLARILAEQKLLTTKVGFLTICAAAVGDIVAWILLALVVSIINSESTITPLYVVLLSIGWILILVFGFRPLFGFMIRKTKSQDEPSQGMMAFTLGLTMVSAFVTDVIGVHAIFGSFLVGLIIPNDTGFADGVAKRIEDLVTVIFLPIYFALSGLKTQVGLLDNGRTWGLVILVTFVACFGKIVGCTGAAKLQGMEWRESFAIGVLMNCKGLVELIVLNIGYDAGVINARVFVIMVAMCLITTCMTAPIVSWIYPPEYQRASAARTLAKEKALRGDLEQEGSSTERLEDQKGIMLCLDKIQNLPAMMTFLEMLHHGGGSNASLENGSASTNQLQHHHEEVPRVPGLGSGIRPFTAGGQRLLALRLLDLTERSSSVLMAATERAEVLRRDTLMIVFQAFAKLNRIPVEGRMTLARDAHDFAKSIRDEALESGAGTIVFPWNGMESETAANSHMPTSPAMTTATATTDGPKPLVTSNTEIVSWLLSETAETDLTTAIFVDREFGGAGHFENILVALYGSVDDQEALKLASAMSHRPQCRIHVVRINKIDGSKQHQQEHQETLDGADKASIDTRVQDIEPVVEHKVLGGATIPVDGQDLVQEFFSRRSFSDKKHNKRFSVASNNTTATALGSNLEIGEGVFLYEVGTPQEAIVLSKTVLGSRDLLVLGRGVVTAPLVSGPSTAQQQQQSVGQASSSVALAPLSPSSSVSATLGKAAHLYLSSEVESCLLVVQAGRR